MATPVYLEVGSKKVFACAVVWPGWCRSGRDEGAALEALAAYADRYAAVLDVAGIRPPRGWTRFDVAERLPGDGGTDFGVPGKPCSLDTRALSARDARRLADLVEASWAVLDEAASASSPTLRKGPRGGGRDRDQIVAHVGEAEDAYFRKVGLRGADRAGFAAALRAARAPSPTLDRGTPWPWRYAARRVAWHALDHAWEIEDKQPG